MGLEKFTLMAGKAGTTSGGYGGGGGGGGGGVEENPVPEVSMRGRALAEEGTELQDVRVVYSLS